MQHAIPNYGIASGKVRVTKKSAKRLRAAF